MAAEAQILTILNILAALHLSRALYKSTLFMQNKPNFWKSQMNVNNVLTKDYEKKTLGEHGKNKPNTNPIQTQTNPISTPKTSFHPQNKPNQTQFQRQKNPSKTPTPLKPPISTKISLRFTSTFFLF